MKYCIATVLVAAVAASCGLARAESIGADQVVTLDLSGNPDDDCDSGIIIWNQSDSAGTVTIEGHAQNEPGDVEDGFVLLDGTLRVSIGDLQPGDYQVLVMREYSPERVRALRREGRKIRGLYMMRRKKKDMDTMRWTRAKSRRSRSKPLEVRAAPKREMREKDRNLLGRQGYDETNCYAWTVVDQASDFAVGARIIPEPSTIILFFGAGGSLLGMLLLRRRQ